MKWAHFSPLVNPYVIGCPQPLIEQHARLAAIEFCRRTLAHVVPLDAAMVFGSPVVEFDPPTGTQIIKLIQLDCEGRRWQIVNPMHGMQMVLDDDTTEFAYVTGQGSVAVYPTQADKTRVNAVAALAPTMTSDGLNDALAHLYASAIMHGAIASIKLVQGQAWSDPNGAVMHKAIFDDRIQTAAMTASIGMARASLRGRPRII